MQFLEFVERYQGLIGAIMTLVAAFLGFGGVIYSQRKLMAMAEMQRLQQKRDELTSFLNAVLGELSSLQGAIESALNVLSAQIAIAEELSGSGAGRKTQPRIAFRFATPVFDSHVDRIGLLSPDLSFKMSSVYGQFKGFNTQVQDQVPEMDPTLAIRIMRSVRDTLRKLSSDAESLATALTASASAAMARKA
ncbi:hypothetical protein [Aestuariivirga sp.]|uniref:hypothetical protein n=1 Tax=Aestuariivirga sp. TaxID=2650926 RepID=UPI00391D79C8